MRNDDYEMDEYAQWLLKPLHSTPPADPRTMAHLKEKYLLHGENLRKDLSLRLASNSSKQTHARRDASHTRQPLTLLRIVVGVLGALVILAGSSITVYASQSSLPGDLLYPVKSLSEDIRLTLTSSPQAKLDLTLDYTDRRMGEITALISGGGNVPDQASKRFNDELDRALILAAGMDDVHMRSALRQIRRMADSQGMTMEELISRLPVQAAPAISHLQQRLQEQIELSLMGENDPTAFRNHVRERQHRPHGQNKSATETAQPGTTLPVTSATPGGAGNGNGQGNDRHQSTDVPGHGGTPPGQGKSTPGNGNHGSEKTQEP